MLFVVLMLFDNLGHSQILPNVKSNYSDDGVQLTDEEIDKAFSGKDEVELTLPF